MIAINGSSVILSALLLRNGIPLTGQDVTVSVVQNVDGLEVLAPVALVETVTPGLYSYSWEGATGGPFTAIFSHNDIIYSEPIDLLTSGGARPAQEIVAEISVPRLETLLTTPGLEATISDNQIEGSVESSEEEGIVQANQITGDADTDDIEGTTSC